MTLVWVKRNLAGISDTIINVTYLIDTASNLPSWPGRVHHTCQLSCSSYYLTCCVQLQYWHGLLCSIPVFPFEMVGCGHKSFEMTCAHMCITHCKFNSGAAVPSLVLQVYIYQACLRW